MAFELLRHLPLNFSLAQEAGLDEPTLNEHIQVHYHDAVDPGLTVNAEGTAWEVVGDGRYTNTPLWTESNWPNHFGARMYRQETPAVTYVMLGAGAGVEHTHTHKHT
jgi:hypothetical protein